MIENLAKIKIAIEAIISCPKNLSLEFRPLEFLNFIFNKSSVKPRIPRLKETKKIKVHT